MIENKQIQRQRLNKITKEYQEKLDNDKDFKELEDKGDKAYKKLVENNVAKIASGEYIGNKNTLLFQSKYVYHVEAYDKNDRFKDFYYKTIALSNADEEKFLERVRFLASSIETTIRRKKRLDIFDKLFITGEEIVDFILQYQFCINFKGDICETIIEDFTDIENVTCTKDVESDKFKGIDFKWEGSNGKVAIGQSKSCSFETGNLDNVTKDKYYNKHLELIERGEINKAIWIFHEPNSLKITHFIDLETNKPHDIEELPEFLNNYLNN